MYETYWKLNHRPFESGADARAYYPGESHQAALLKLRYVIENRHGAALLAGGYGVGKTLLVRLLAEQLPDRFKPLAHLVYPQMPADELLAFLAAELGAAATTSSPTVAESVLRLQQRLTSAVQQGRHVVVAIDDAQLLEGRRTFEALRLLLNFEVDGRPAMTLLLVGQPSLLPTLERLPQFDERLGAKCLLRPFSIDETVSYVQHRLAAAGSRQPIFEDAALELLYDLTLGVPRRINRLCDLSLLIGFADERPAISKAQIQAVAQELSLAGAE